MGGLRRPSAAPHVPAADGVQPAGADDGSRRIRPRCPPGDYDIAVFDNLFPTLHAVARRVRRPAIVDTRPGARRLRGGRLQPGPAGLARRPAALAHRAAARGLGRSHARARRARRRAVRVSVREPRRRGRRDAAPPARTDLRVPVRAAAGRRESSSSSSATTTSTAAACSRICWRARSTTAGGSSTTASMRSPSCRSARATPTRAGSRRGARVPSLTDLTADERGRPRARAEDAAAEVRRAAGRGPFPTCSACHQAPTDGQPHPEAHLHFEFYPAYRMRGPLEVPRRQRARRRRLHRRHAARGQGARAAGESRCRSREPASDVRRSLRPAAAGHGAGARPRQPDWRAHRLQRRLRAAARRSRSGRASRLRRPATTAFAPGARTSAPNGMPASYRLGDERARHDWVDFVAGRHGRACARPGSS